MGAANGGGVVPQINSTATVHSAQCTAKVICKLSFKFTIVNRKFALRFLAL
jgi:hypothetical protein